MKRHLILIIAAPIMLLAGCSQASSTIPATPPGCQTPEYIEKLNHYNLKQVARVKSANAKLLIALDPVLSEPDFHYEGYRDESFISSMEALRKKLAEARVDEVIIWQLTRHARLGVAVPFDKGCALDGLYGEPDMLEKLQQMHKTYLLIMERGLDDPSVRDGIKQILMTSRYAGHYNDAMVDAMIATVRQVTGPASDVSK